MRWDDDHKCELVKFRMRRSWPVSKCCPGILLERQRIVCLFLLVIIIMNKCFVGYCSKHWQV